MANQNDKKQQKRGIFQSVKFRLILIIVAIMAVPLIVSVIISYNFTHSEAVESMESLNKQQVKTVEHDINAIVVENKQLLETVATSDAAREAIQTGLNVSAVSAWLAKADELMGDGNVMAITNSSGMQIAKSSGDLVDVSDREYFQQVKSTGQFYVSNQNISKTTGARICTFIYPVTDTSGNFIGAVQRNYNLSVFTEQCKGEIQAEKQDIFIGDNNGDLLAHTSMDLDTGEPVNFSTQAWFTDSRNDAEASGIYGSHFNDNDWKISYQREAITGWTVVVASSVNVAMAGANRMILITVIIGVIMLLVAIVLSVMLADSFTRPIFQVNKVIAKLTDGEMQPITDRSLLARKDEFGEIVTKLNELIERLRTTVQRIKEASATVMNQAKELSDTSSQISCTTDDVSNAVQEIASGATEQADTVETSTEQMSNLSEAIQTVAERAEQLADAASEMNEASQSSSSALKQLSSNMDTMGVSLADISKAMQATNLAVQNVNERVDGITSIASQTNLLALNASIEAARAGEAGKGFAVVAEEIGKLATESATTAQEIRSEMTALLQQAQAAIEKTNEVSGIGNDVNVVLENTVDKINMLINGVGATVENVGTITNLTQECDESKSVIVQAMTGLAAISQENAASTEETSASMQELNATINLLSGSAKSLNDVAVQLDEDLSFFKL